MPTRTGPPTVAGRWSRLPEREPNATRRTTARTEALLERHGVLTRGAVMAEQVVGGFSAVYPVLRAFEENNRARRGYFVETLGAAQFGTPGVDRPAPHVRLARPGARAAPWCWRRPTGERLRRRAALARASGRRRPEAVDVGEGTGATGRRATGRGARPARWSCWSTASWCSTSSAAARRCCRGPRTSTCSRRRLRRCPARCRPARWADGRAEGRRGERCTLRRRCRPRCRRPGSPRRRGASGCAAEPRNGRPSPSADDRSRRGRHGRTSHLRRVEGPPLPVGAKSTETQLR